MVEQGKRNGVTVKFEYKKQDLWVGAYWQENDVWVCLVPMFPIHITFVKGDK